MTPADLVATVSNLVSLPEVCLRINELIDDPHTTSAVLGEVISHDPALTARLLKLVNSAYYGLPSRIETISHAVTMVGLSDLQSLVLAASAVTTFRNIPSTLVDMESFWHHSVYTGLVTRIFAERLGLTGKKEQLFLIGLLHDVGRLVMFHVEPEWSRTVLARSADADVSPVAAEKEQFGFTHADVGAELLRAWNLPSALWEPVAQHHAPELAHEFPRESAIVHLANAIAQGVEPGMKFDAPQVADLPAHPQAWAAAGIPEDWVEDVVTEANLRSFEVLSVIAPAAAVIV